MATQPESRIVAAIGRYLDTLERCWWFKVHGGPYQKAGVPDIIGLIDGRFFGIEVKVPGNKPTAIQMLIMRRIEAAGGIVGVATSVDEAKHILCTDVYTD